MSVRTFTVNTPPQLTTNSSSILSSHLSVAPLRRLPQTLRMSQEQSLVRVPRYSATPKPQHLGQNAVLMATIPANLHSNLREQSIKPQHPLFKAVLFVPHLPLHRETFPLASSTQNRSVGQEHHRVHQSHQINKAELHHLQRREIQRQRAPQNP